MIFSRLRRVYMFTVLLLLAARGHAEDDTCHASLTREFSASALLRVNLLSESVDPSDLELLEQLFTDSYNDFSPCGQEGAFVRLDTVQIFTDPLDALVDRRNLQFLQSYRRIEGDRLQRSAAELTAQEQVTWLMSVTGQANICSDEIPLFNEDVVSRRHEDMALRQLYESLEEDSSTKAKQDETTRSLRLNFGSSGGRRVCECTCLPPPKLDVLDEINERLMDEGAIDGIVSIENITALEEVPCSSTMSTTFEAPIIIQTTAIYPDNITEVALRESLQELEVSLRDSYNQINFLNDETCDPFGRIVTQVRIEIEELVSDAQVGVMNATGMMVDSREVPGSLVPTVVAYYSGKCDGCADELTGNGRRLQSEEMNQLSESMWERSLATSGCACPEGSTLRGPSNEELATSINTTLQAVPLIDLQATSISEAAVVNCSSDRSRVQSNTSLSLVVNDAFLDQFDAVLGDIVTVFEQAYNTLSQGYCDPLFRQILNVDLIDFDLTPFQRTLQLDVGNATTNITNIPNCTNSTNIPGNSTNCTTVGLGNNTGTGILYTVNVNTVVVGNCRGCGMGTTFFNDVAARSLKETPFKARKTPRLRDLQTVNHNCICPIETVAERAPSTTEHASFLEETILGDSRFDAVESVSGLVEG